jgi:hypothetical protein
LNHDRNNRFVNFSVITNNIEELKKAVQNKKITDQTMNVLQKGEFIDKENSDFSIELSEDHGWKINFCSSETNK